MKAKERYPQARARLITDKGSQFIWKDFKELIALLEMEISLISAGHPQSNGKLERFHQTFRSEHVRQKVYLSYQDAVERMGRWITYYNQERLHAGIMYLPPEEVISGMEGTEACGTQRETAYCKYQQTKVLGSPGCRPLNHLISFPQKVQVRLRQYSLACVLATRRVKRRQPVQKPHHRVPKFTSSQGGFPCP
jgi:hypothetical protein